MSFDTEFDYTGSITFIDNRTDAINAEISAITTTLSDLAAVDSADPSFSYLTTPQTASLTQANNVYASMVSNLQALKGEINIVTGLSSADKANLYAFYTNSINEPKKRLVSARKTGYFASSGDLIANVDADTRLTKGWIETVFSEGVNLETVGCSSRRRDLLVANRPDDG